MAELRSEEEQVEALKRWWKENAVSLIAGVAIAAAVILGWKAWQNYQANQAEAASIRYQQLLALAGQQTLDEGALSEAESLTTSLRNEHGKTLYADLAVLIQARLLVNQQDNDAARALLRELIDSTNQPYIADLAGLRLARLLLAADQAEEALDILDGEVASALAAQQADLRGDAQLALNHPEEARQAYRRALSLAEQSDLPLFGTQLKLDNLGTLESPKALEASDASTTPDASDNSGAKDSSR